MKVRSKSRLGSLIELVVIVAVAFGLALLIQQFIVKPYKIPSGSMEPTLAIEQRVLVDRIGMSFEDPEIGDIVVFHPPRGAEREPGTRYQGEECGGIAQPPHRVTYTKAACDQPNTEEASVNFIKRVVAGPGDWIYIRAGHVYLSASGRKGTYRREQDSYITPCGPSPECNFLTPIKIPAGHWFMMGDNRGESDDSRFWGPVPTKWIIGVAFATYWPPERIGFF